MNRAQTVPLNRRRIVTTNVAPQYRTCRYRFRRRTFCAVYYRRLQYARRYRFERIPTYPRVSTRTPITAAITGAHDAPAAAHRHAMLHMHIAACETRNGRCLPPFDRRRHLKITI
ncbi:hypothetical protein QZM19_12630 [Burkholderia multivorans]|uniref:hypothetical protein n=1 Tax=Burkholderia multivorans TaxID=87883 RepID=UPI0021C1B863|nr:hypothetical protein [Burkholderia multivorans]MDN7864239.1 hypothetical protein [Burkholderia multivorans]